MPRRIAKRRWKRPPAAAGELDPAVAEFLIDGDTRRAADALERRGESTSRLWQHHELGVLWHAHRAVLLAEAKRRGIAHTHGEDTYDDYSLAAKRFKTRATSTARYEPDPSDPRLTFLKVEEQGDDAA